MPSTGGLFGQPLLGSLLLGVRGVSLGGQQVWVRGRLKQIGPG